MDMYIIKLLGIAVWPFLGSVLLLRKTKVKLPIIIGAYILYAFMFSIPLSNPSSHPSPEEVTACEIALKAFYAFALLFIFIALKEVIKEKKNQRKGNKNLQK